MPPLELPLGLGTSRLDDPAECRATVAAALEAGYRHVDTAQMYDNETAVGEGSPRPTWTATTWSWPRRSTPTTSRQRTFARPPARASTG